MNIKIAQLAKKPFDVKKSGKNLKKTYQFQLDMAKLQDKIAQAAKYEEVDATQLSDEEREQQEKKELSQTVAMFQGMIDMHDTTSKYLVDILKLNEKQTDDLEELEQEEIVKISQMVAGHVTGADLSGEQDEDEGLQPQEN